MLNETIQKIKPINESVMAKAHLHQDQLAIPLGSLGRLHEINIRMAGITSNPRPDIRKLAIITMAADHGVAVQGVSRFPQEVTREMVVNFAKGGAAINVLSRHVGARLTVVDMGVAGNRMAPALADNGDIRFVSCNIAPGTDDISVGPAMTRDQAIQSLEAGIEVFCDEHERGVDAIGIGDMGIANTTPSSAIAAAFLKISPEKLVNRGTGIDDQAFINKIQVVENALKVNQPDSDDPIDVLSKVGGFEIGGIAGTILGACANGVPVVIDGFISTAAALLASRFHPNVKNYLFSGHLSAVEGHHQMLQYLGLTPLVNLDLRLGEGTGAAFGLSVLQAASRVATEMLTFDEASVSGPDE